MFPTSQAPRFQGTHGYVFGVVWVAVMTIWLSVILPLVERYFENRDRHRIDEDYGRDIVSRGDDTLAK